MKIKKFAPLIFLIFGVIAYAQTSALEPLESWQKTRPGWGKDPSDVGYVAVRCSALYGVVAATFTNLGRTKEDRERGVDGQVRGMLLLLFGSKMSESVGWSSERISQRFQNISDIYQKTVSYNRTTHNNIFHGFVLDDYKFCVAFESTVKAVANEVGKPK